MATRRWKICDDMFIRFDMIHKRDRHTDGRTDTAWRHRPRLHSIARQKLTCSQHWSSLDSSPGCCGAQKPRQQFCMIHTCCMCIHTKLRNIPRQAQTAIHWLRLNRLNSTTSYQTAWVPYAIWVKIKAYFFALSTNFRPLKTAGLSAAVPIASPLIRAF